jgi:branched-chain amino acid transport system substrate-binding protein
MDGKQWCQGRIVWERKPGAPPPAMRTSKGYRLRRAAVAFIVLSLVVSLVGCTASNAGKEASTGGGTAEKAPYKIGAVVSLTGTYAGLGGPEKTAIDMEVERINAAGGINGHKLEVVLVDDGTDAAKATAAASKLIDQDKVLAVIGATGTGQTMAMRQAIDKAGIPQVSMAGGTVITSTFDKLVFQTPWSNSLVVPYELKAMQAKGIKQVALLTSADGFGKDGQAVLKAELPKFGMTAVADETFNTGDTDMTAQLTKIAAAKPQAIILWNAGKESVTVLKNREQLKITIPVYGSHGNARKETIEGGGAAAEGFTFAAGKILVPAEYGQDTPAYKVATDFVDRFTTKAGQAPSTFAGHAYDALNITVEAMKKLPEGFTSAQLRDEIEKTSGFVGIGGTFTFSATDHNGLTENDLVLYTVKDGAFTVVK